MGSEIPSICTFCRAVLKPGTQRPISSPVTMANAIQIGNNRSSVEKSCHRGGFGSSSGGGGLGHWTVPFAEPQSAMSNTVSPPRRRRCRRCCFRKRRARNHRSDVGRGRCQSCRNRRARRRPPSARRGAGHPNLVLGGETAGSADLFVGKKPSPVSRAISACTIGRLDLHPQMIHSATLTGIFQQHQFQRRIGDREVGVAMLGLAGSVSKSLE